MSGETVPATNLDALLDRLAGLTCRFEPNNSLRAQKLLAQLGRRRLPDATSLIRFHEILLFLRAYPHTPAMRLASDDILASFHKRVTHLRASGADLSAFADPPVSGIAGTAFSAIWSYDIVRYLAALYPSRVEIDWEGYENDELLVSVLKSFLPLLEDGAYVAYPVPYLTWIHAAKRHNETGETDLAWLLRQFEHLAIDEREKANLFDSLKIWVHWKLGNSPATRTRMRLRVNRTFYHDGPLIIRSEVSLARELADRLPLPFKKLSRADGDKLVSLGRDMMTVRYRELHGFTYGDPRHVLRASAGRGVEFVIWGLPPGRRLPLLGYHAVLILKNGVPAGYAESLALFERTEVGVNLFYTFRDGESAWIYARLLRFLRQYLHVSVFSVEPYQLGSHNEEGIEAGAFWFYRKLGFRPVQPRVARMVERQERKLAKRPGYRTPARILRQLAAGHLLYEAPSAPHPGEWDNFRVPNIGLAVQSRLVQQLGGGERKRRQALVTSVAHALGVKPTDMSASEQRVFSDLALMLAMIPGLSRWSKEEKSAIKQIIRAKAGTDELRYVRLLQRHQKLRDGLLMIGSRGLNG
ncbi:MAG: hypothetical protein ND866_00055 [Pyrinomonadaceae bacterium]|nr:hypothetical protein [Pyrinomonadaceae bacterium]